MARLKPREARLRRHKRVRKKIKGTPERPRLVVFRSLSHIYAQVIDDTSGRTLLSASSVDKDFPSDKRGSNIEGAEVVGRLVAEKAKVKGVTRVVYDRGGYIYHGRVKALAEGARKAGLEL